jgi:uncharacterized membrane protein
MVFGLALSVGALALVTSPPTNSGQLVIDIASFGFSFLILIMVWFAYTRIMSVLPLETRLSTSLNTVLLFSVSIEPFLFNVLKEPSLTLGYFDTVSTAYAIDLGVMMVVLGLFGWELATARHAVLGSATQTSFRNEAVNRWIVAGIFFASAAPVFGTIEVGGEYLRIWLWLVPLILFRLNRHRVGVQST